MSYGEFSTYSPGSRPTVRVRDEVREQIGNPSIDFDGLAEMYYGDLGLPRDIQPKLDLRELKNKAMYGYHVPLTRTVHVDPIKCTDIGATHPLHEVILHESKHLLDSVKHPVGAVAGSAARMGVLAGGTYLTYRAMKNGVLPDIGTAVQNFTGLDGAVGDVGAAYIDFIMLSYGIGGKLASRLYYQYLDMAEISARRVQNDEALQRKYSRVIDFPDRRLLRMRRMFGL